MHTFVTLIELKQYLDQQRKVGKTIGFVPTMGALHAGHLSLIRKAKDQNDLVVCSIFVNPTQFNNPEDLAKYPRTLPADSLMLESEACDVLFAPNAEEMYPKWPQITFDFGNLERVLEGAFRPGHFNGVGIVVSKLFNAVQPDQAYFGQKDLQQCLIIRQLVQDLSFNLRLHICPTQRETDGLAMSSRNVNLSESLRAQAPIIYQTLTQAKARLSTQTVEEVKHFVSQQFGQIPALNLEYFEVSTLDTLAPISGMLSGSAALCIAVFFGKTRLIDNILVGVNGMTNLE
jgi:pantoate--beta-alanine ligase